jgi:hypothetical protein
VTLTRFLATACAGCCAYIAIFAVRQCRTWTVLELRHGTLSCTVPSVLGYQTRHFNLSAFERAVLKKDDSTTDVLLEGRGDDAKSVVLTDALGGAVYRTADLEYVARVINEAVAGNLDAGPPAAGLTTASPAGRPSSAARTGR